MMEPIKKLKIYLVSRPFGVEYIEDEFNICAKFMVCCDDEIQARKFHPVKNIILSNGKWIYRDGKFTHDFCGWISPEFLDKITVKYYGEAGNDIFPGVIISEFFKR